MKVAVVGLGLIGGSFCRAIKKYTNHMCVGIDVDKNVVSKAIEQGAIDGEIAPNHLGDVDMVIVCLHPQSTMAFLKENAGFFKEGAIIIDTCGIKEEIVRQVGRVLLEKKVVFIPAHPMAGTENSGFDHSTADLFRGASFIITPGPHVPKESIQIVEQLSKKLGFRQMVISTTQVHDSIIAFTSQLAHIVSSAYIKSPTASLHAGFSAGSFQDMTRVAKLNENMWTELFMMNRENLLFEIESIMKSLDEYAMALKDKDEDSLRMLLREGRILKEDSLKRQAL